MRKSVSKRIRVTRTGKVMRRAMAQGHFLSKKRTEQLQRKKQMRGLNFGKKIVKKYM